MSRRNWLIRILQALVIVAVASSFAHADNFMYFKKKAAAGGGGACSASIAQGLSTNTGAVAGDTYLGNKILTTAARNVCKVEVYIYKNASDTSDVYIELRDDNSDSPSASVLATSSAVAASSIPDATTFAWVAFEFSTPVSLLDATYYWVVIKKTTGFDITLGYDNGSPEHIVKWVTDAWVDVSISRQGNYRLYVTE